MSEFLKFNPKELELKKTYHLLLVSLTFCPLGFTARMSKDGYIDIALFSYYNAFGSNPLI